MIIGLTQKGNKRFGNTKRLIALYLCLLILPMSVFMYFYYKQSTQIVEKQTSYQILQTLKQTELNVSEKLNNLIDVSNIFFMNSYLSNILSRSAQEDTMSQQIDDMKELDNLINNMDYKKNIYSKRIFFNKSKIYSAEGINFFPISELESKAYYKDIYEKNGAIYWKGTYLQRYIDRPEEYIISCCRILRNRAEFSHIVGAVLVDIKEATLYDILSKVGTYNNQTIYILDKNGIILSHRDKSKIGTKNIDDKLYSEILKSSEGINTYKENGVEKYFIHKVNPDTSWNIITEIPKADLVGSDLILNNISTFVVIIFILIFFLCLVFGLYAFVSESLRSKVKKITSMLSTENMVSQAENANIKKELNINSLENSIIMLLNSYRASIQESYELKVKEREAQLKALQAQINPHFLYNALDTINWMAIKKDARDISFMVDSLAKYFRLSLNNGHDIITVNDEISLSRAYLNIQEKRFEGSLNVSYNISELILEHKIPKLILQPIIENAILHGIQNKGNKAGMLSIQAYKEGDNIVFKVMDDGVGMSEDQVAILLNKDMHYKQQGYGIFNVYERLKIYCNDKCEFIINSKIGEGTEVIIKVGISTFA